MGDWAEQIARGVAILLCAIGCAGTDRQVSKRASNRDSAADPSAQVTLHSTSQPNRNGSGQDLGRGVANKLLTEVSDCELTECTGNPTQQLIKSVQGRAAQARSCYEEALKAIPTLAGRLIVNFRVTHGGQLCPIKIVQNELATSRTLVPCLRSLMERSYPRPEGGCVDFNLPLKFVPEYFEADAGTAGPTTVKLASGETTRMS